MPGHPIECTVVEKEFLTPSILRMCFEPRKKFRYESGQFLSLIVPTPGGPDYRLYSFASAFEKARDEGYEICVKLREGGKASTYLKNLQIGSQFKARAPYGDFRFIPPKDGRSVCMIGTGTGVGPLKAMLESKAFQRIKPSTLLLIGAPTMAEMPFKRLISGPAEIVYCLSREPKTAGYKRVTEFLEQLPASTNWAKTDFYLCGNQAMIHDVEYFLRMLRGVLPTAIHKDAFFSTDPKRIDLSQPQSSLSAWKNPLSMK